MKRCYACVLVISLLLCLCGCGKTVEKPKISADTVLESVLKDYKNTKMSKIICYGDKDYEKNFERLYGIDISLVCDGAIAFATEGMSADEISLLVAADDNAVKDIKEALNNRISTRTADFVGYAPAQVSKLSNARVMQNGRYIALIVSSKTIEIQGKINKVIKGE